MSVSNIKLYFFEKSKIYKKLNKNLILKVFKFLTKTYDNDGTKY